MRKVECRWLGMAATAIVLCFAVPGATIACAAEGEVSAVQREGGSYDSGRDSREEFRSDDGGSDLLKAVVVIAGAAVLYNIFKNHHHRDRDRRDIHRPGPNYRYHDYGRYDRDEWRPRIHRPNPDRRPGPAHRPAPRPHTRDARPRHHR